jgi:hypothetical protein
MKKIGALLIAMVLILTTTFAQAKQDAGKSTAETKTSSVPLKKDGTPDKRYKKSKTEVTGPLKKDGTPDKRYKANKKG